jgi:hypothetical protein
MKLKKEICVSMPLASQVYSIDGWGVLFDPIGVEDCDYLLFFTNLASLRDIKI